MCMFGHNFIVLIIGILPQSNNLTLKHIKEKLLKMQD